MQSCPRSTLHSPIVSPSWCPDYGSHLLPQLLVPEPLAMPAPALVSGLRRPVLPVDRLPIV